MAPLLLSWRAQLAAGAAAPASVIASGLLAREADGIAGEFALSGLHERARLQDGDWAALLLVREG